MSNIPNRNLFDGQNHLYGVTGDGLAAGGYSLHVTGNNTTHSIAVHNPGGADLQVEIARQHTNIWVPVGELINDSRIYYSVWMNDYLYRVRQLTASADPVTVYVKNNIDYPLEYTNGGFYSAVTGSGASSPVTPGAHTHTLSDITDLNDADDLPSGIAAPAPAPLVAGGSVQDQLLALAAAYDPYDSSLTPINITGLAPAIGTIPGQVDALTGDKAEPGDTVTARFDDYFVEYERNAAGTAWVELDRTERGSAGSDWLPITSATTELTHGDYSIGKVADLPDGTVSLPVNLAVGEHLTIHDPRGRSPDVVIDFAGMTGTIEVRDPSTDTVTTVNLPADTAGFAAKFGMMKIARETATEYVAWVDVEGSGGGAGSVTFASPAQAIAGTATGVAVDPAALQAAIDAADDKVRTITLPLPAPDDTAFEFVNTPSEAELQALVDSEGWTAESFVVITPSTVEYNFLNRADAVTGVKSVRLQSSDGNGYLVKTPILPVSPQINPQTVAPFDFTTNIGPVFHFAETRGLMVVEDVDGIHQWVSAPQDVAYRVQAAAAASSDESIQFYADYADFKSNWTNEERFVIVDRGHSVWEKTVADISAEVSTDVTEGVYIPLQTDLTGASGGFVRKFHQLNAEFFGLRESNTSAQNTTALNELRNFANRNGIVEGHVKAGTYNIDRFLYHYDAVNNPNAPDLSAVAGRSMRGRFHLIGSGSSTYGNMLNSVYVGTTFVSSYAGADAVIFADGDAYGEDTHLMNYVQLQKCTVIANSTGPVVHFKRTPQRSGCHDVAIYQQGAGDGYIHESQWITRDSDLFIAGPEGAVKTGIGYHNYQASDSISGGFKVLDNIISRGFRTSVKLGGDRLGTASQGHGYVLNAVQGSQCDIGIMFGNGLRGVRGTVHAEGCTIGYMFIGNCKNIDLIPTTSGNTLDMMVGWMTTGFASVDTVVTALGVIPADSSVKNLKVFGPRFTAKSGTLAHVAISSNKAVYNVDIDGPSFDNAAGATPISGVILEPAKYNSNVIVRNEDFTGVAYTNNFVNELSLLRNRYQFPEKVEQITLAGGTAFWQDTYYPKIHALTTANSSYRLPVAANAFMEDGVELLFHNLSTSTGFVNLRDSANVTIQQIQIGETYLARYVETTDSWIVTQQ